jgi:hypothetical protein
MEIFFGHSGLMFVSIICVLFLNLLLFFSDSTYAIWQQHFQSHVDSAIFVTGCLHLSVSILRLFKYVAFDFVSESLQHDSNMVQIPHDFQQQKIRNHRDGTSDFVMSFTTSEITSSYMFQRLKARILGIQGVTAWCRVEVEFMSASQSQQPYLSGRCTCRFIDVGEVEQVHLDIEGDSVLLSSVTIQNTDSGRCWKSLDSKEVWLHPGSPIHVPVGVTFDHVLVTNTQLADVDYFRIFSSSQLLLLLINIAASAVGTFLYAEFFVLLFIDVALYLPLVRGVLLVVVSSCFWPLFQIIILVLIVIFLSSIWVFLYFRDSMIDQEHRYTHKFI